MRRILAAGVLLILAACGEGPVANTASVASNDTGPATAKPSPTPEPITGSIVYLQCAGRGATVDTHVFIDAQLRLDDARKTIERRDDSRGKWKKAGKVGVYNDREVTYDFRYEHATFDRRTNEFTWRDNNPHGKAGMILDCRRVSEAAIDATP